MQITGGKFRGFKIKVPKDIRPTSAFNRKRIFDIIGDVEGLRVWIYFAEAEPLVWRRYQGVQNFAYLWISETRALRW